MARALTILGLTFFLVGCPGSTADSGPVASCADAKVGQKCRLEAGQLGVCMMDSSGNPFCQDQH